MKTICFGSLNIDHVYTVPHFVRPGETLASEGYRKFPGGKGLNQSIALARAGMQVYHAGCIGQDGLFLKKILEENRVNVSLLEVVPETPTGHAVIQVDPSGENCIMLYSGANFRITSALIERTFQQAEAGDFLLIQNEIAMLPEIIRAAAAKKMRIFFNPAPMTEAVLQLPLEYVDTLIVNETEAEMAGASLAGHRVVMTLGSRGARYLDENQTVKAEVPAEKVEKIVDTTAAGDTFIGFFISGIASGMSETEALKLASRAAAICISRPGAASSIPEAREVNGGFMMPKGELTR